MSETLKDREVHAPGQGSPALLVLHPADNTAVALRDLSPGEYALGEEGGVLGVQAAIPAAHKVATEDIPVGALVKKFGVVIGTATQSIGRGDHVHVHNVASERMRGDR